MANQLRIKLDSDSNVIFPDSIFGVDVNNVIASGTIGSGYTATQDCYFTGAGYEWVQFKINTVHVYSGSYGASNEYNGPMVLLKGQKVTTTASWGNGDPKTAKYRVFGFKY